MPVSETYVLFADILGFAELVLNSPGQALSDNDFLRPESASSVRPSLHQRDDPLTDADRLLMSRFANFHKVIEETLADYKVYGGLGAVVFSDCVFIQFPTAELLAEAAVRLMWRFLFVAVPVRMGIAKGTFNALGFSSNVSRRVNVHMSQFYGTGVVRAYRAERSGKGLRIFIDRSIESDVDAAPSKYNYSRRLALEPPFGDVRSELNYLQVVYGAPIQGKSNPLGTTLDVCRDRVMALATTAPAHKLEYYTSTVLALERMNATFLIG